MNTILENETIRLDFRVNGQEMCVDVLPGTRLVDVLRETLGLTGVKEGCGVGECGACTVIVNGESVNSCLIPAIQMQGAQITTIEGLKDSSGLHPLQQSFIDNNAIGCGFCTPGAILSAKVLLDKIPNPTDEQIREGLSGNLCRCTGYDAFVAAVRWVAQQNQRKQEAQASR